MVATSVGAAVRISMEDAASLMAYSVDVPPHPGRSRASCAPRHKYILVQNPLPLSGERGPEAYSHTCLLLGDVPFVTYLLQHPAGERQALVTHVIDGAAAAVFKSGREAFQHFER